MGRFTDIGAFTFINAINGVTLEDEVQIGPHCSIMSASTIDNKWGPIILKKKCCIGANSVVMPNVTIGENSIIGANSFVNKTIPANVMAFGTPIEVWKKIK
jgi:acetyltransferase-like isoleucine patch superfamily enzyme